jgi:hypothetical protein
LLVLGTRKKGQTFFWTCYKIDGKREGELTVFNTDLVGGSAAHDAFHMNSFQLNDLEGSYGR